MKLIITTSNLKTELAKVEKAISSSKLIADQNLLFFSFKKDQPLALTAINDKFLVETSIEIEEATVMSDCDFGIDGKLFCEFIKRVQDDYIAFELKDTQLLLKTKNASIKFAIKNVLLPSFVFDAALLTPIELNPFEFIEALTAVGYATAKDDARPLLKGINIAIKDSKLIFVALDGYRLAKTQIEIANNVESFLNITILFSVIGILNSIITASNLKKNKQLNYF